MVDWLKRQRLLPNMVWIMSFEWGPRRAVEGFKRHGCVVSTAIAIVAGTASVVGCAASTRVKTPTAAISGTTGGTEATSRASTTPTSRTTSRSTESAATFSEPSPPVPTATGGSEATPTCTAERPVVVLDPGHSGGPNFDATAEVDGPEPVTGLGITFQPVDIDGSGIMSIDNAGAPGERVTMWQAALRIQKILRSAGYTVDLTKSSVDENVGLLSRVREAINDHASIAVSLHYTDGIPFGAANAHFGVTPQQVGLYRTNVTNGDTIRFTNARVAAESQRDAKIIQQARAAAGDGVDVAPLDESFPESRGLPAYGDISIVQVVDQQFPWIYNEDGDIGFNFDDYTTGIANGIERAVPIAACLRPHG
jgi:N-acetylmuramoyl-L-alanine amidase